MTITVKLDPKLEQQLRQRAAGTGRSASDVIRAALVAYLNQAEPAEATSAYALGRDLFGRFGADVDLAQERKRRLEETWSAKHDARDR
jgi:plasmid stability protein